MTKVLKQYTEKWKKNSKLHMVHELTKSFNNSRFAIQIVTHNALESVKKCLQELAWVEGVDNVEIFVVDNASEEEVVQFICQQYPFVKVKANRANKGFAYAQNQAFAMSQQNNFTPDYVLLINPDAVITKQQISVLIKKMVDSNQARVGVGIVAPRIQNGSKLEHSIHPTPNILDMVSRLFYIDLEYLRTKHLYNKVSYVPGVSGACLLIRTDMIKQIGLFDERYFFYNEDVDFCIRARKAGWSVLYTPNVIIQHAKSKSSETPKKGWFWRREQACLSTLQFFRKYRSVYEFTLLKAGWLIEMLLRILLKNEKIWAKSMYKKITAITYNENE